MNTDTRSTLSLGPLLYLWSPGQWRDFYLRIADEAPVDVVTLGEVVCSKRQHFHAPYLDQVVSRLRSAGKTVKLASLALVSLEREQRSTRALADLGDFEIEMNDLSVLPTRNGRAITVGPLVNVYNGATARFYGSRGATTICLPPELPIASVRDIIAGAPTVGFEYFAFGRVPLAMSARCAHARVKGLTKDNCQFICGEDRDGLEVKTLDQQSFLTLNGIQTMSYTCQSALTDLQDLRGAGVSQFRLSPQHCDMVEVSTIFRSTLDGELGHDEASARLKIAYPNVPLSNGFLHGVEGHHFVGAA